MVNNQWKCTQQSRYCIKLTRPFGWPYFRDHLPPHTPPHTPAPIMYTGPKRSWFLRCCVVLQKGADAERFFSYIVVKVLPALDEVTVTEETGDLKLELFKVLAEICTYKISEDVLNSSLDPIFDKLLVSASLQSVLLSFYMSGARGIDEIFIPRGLVLHICIYVYMYICISMYICIFNN